MSKLIIYLVVLAIVYFIFFALAKAAERGDRLSGICELNTNIDCTNQCCNFCSKRNGCSYKCEQNHLTCKGF